MLESGALVCGQEAEFEIIGPPRRGASGAVYPAIRRGDGRPAAVKVTRRPDAAAFEQEVHCLRQLGRDARTLPQIYDWRVDGERAVLMMEHFPAGSLQAQLEARGPLDADALRRLLDDLLEALVVVHARSLVHLDVKPANVLVAPDRFVLADFGLSRAFGTRADVLPTSPGTPGYRAPEQVWARAHQIGTRTDLYGLGATAWSAATGRSLAQADETTDWAAFHGLPSLHTTAPEVPEPLANIVMHMLRAHAERRPGSAAEVRHRLWHPPQIHGVLAERVVCGEAACASALDEIAHPLLRHIVRSTEQLRLARFEAGDLLCITGEASYHAFLLLRGRVRIYRDGRDLTVLESPGEIFGETAAITGVPRTATMEADVDTTCAVFNAGELLDFLRANPECTLQLVANLAERLAR